MFQTARAASQDPSTPPARLARLARSGDWSRASAVARNPSTPEETLRHLARAHAAAVGSNPSTPADILDELSKAKEQPTREAVASNPSTPSATLIAMSKAVGSTTAMRVLIARNPGAAGEVLAALLPHFGGSAELKLAVAAHLNALPSTLESLVEHQRDGAEINAVLARNPATPTSARASLFRRNELRSAVLGTLPAEDMEERIAQVKANSYAGTPLIELLSFDGDAEVRRAVAAFGTLNDEIVARLLADEDAAVVAVATARASSDTHILDKLAAGDDDLALEAMVRNPATTSDLKAQIFQRVVKVGDVRTLRMIAGDADVPADVLKVLAEHSDTHVRSAAAANPAHAGVVAQVLATDAVPAVRVAAAATHGLAIDVALSLSVDQDAAVRRSLAANPTTPSDLLLRMAADRDGRVAEAVAKHPSATAAVLLRVATTQRALAGEKRPFNSPAFSTAALAAVVVHPSSSADALREAASALPALSSELSTHRDRHELDTIERLWQPIARHPAASAELLDDIAHRVRSIKGAGNADHDARAREGLRHGVLRAIVQNPSASIETLESLASGDWAARGTREMSERDDGHTITWTVWDDSATRAAVAEAARQVGTEISRRRWAEGATPSERGGFARDPHTAVEILDVLAQDTDAVVRRAVAANPSTSAEAFAALAADTAAEVRMVAATAMHPGNSRHPAPPYGRKPAREVDYVDGFAALFGDPDAKIRAAVIERAANFWNALPPGLADRAAYDEAPAVRAALVRLLEGTSTSHDAPHLSTNALVHLVETGDPDVWRFLADRQLELRGKVVRALIETGDGDTVLALIRTRKARRKHLVGLAASEDAAIVQAVASVAHSEPGSLLDALLGNPNAPVAFLQWAAWNAPDAHRRARALAHPALPLDALLRFARSDDEAKLRELAAVENADLRQAIASNSAAPPDVLVAMADGADRALREAILVNPGSPPELLVRLMSS